MVQSRLAQPVLGHSRRLTTSVTLNRVAVLPITESAFARPATVDIATYQYPGNPSYLGMGPKALAEQWETEERVVHYCVPKTLVEFLEPKLGATGLYTVTLGGLTAFLSKEWLVFHAETMTAVTLFMACTFLNIMAGDMVRNTIEEEFTATYDKFYACKEHDIAAYTEIVTKYKDAQQQAQGQAIYNQQKLTNLALMLDAEFYQRQNSLVEAVTKKLNYQVAIQNALADQERNHMINWIQTEVNSEIANLDQDEMIRVCVDSLKSQA